MKGNCKKATPPPVQITIIYQVISCCLLKQLLPNLHFFFQLYLEIQKSAKLDPKNEPQISKPNYPSMSTRKRQRI